MYINTGFSLPKILSPIIFCAPKKDTTLQQISDMFCQSFINQSTDKLIITPLVDWIKSWFTTSSFLKKVNRDSQLFQMAPDKFHELILDPDVHDSVSIYITNLLKPQNRAQGNETRMNSLIFSGPPGTGKTEIMRHIALELKRVFRRKSKIFFLIGSHLIIKDEEKAISILSNIFQQITTHIKKGGIAYLAIDEADSILSNSNNIGNRSGLLTHFLSLMTAVELTNAQLRNGGQCIFVISTNIPEAITPAFARRLHQITFSIPSFQTQVKVFEYYIKKYTHDGKKLRCIISKETYQQIISKFLRSITQGVLENIVKAATMRAVHYYPHSNVLSTYCILKVLKDELMKHYTMTEKLSSEQAEQKLKNMEQDIKFAEKEHLKLIKADIELQKFPKKTK